MIQGAGLIGTGSAGGLVPTFNPSDEQAFSSKVTCESPELCSQLDRCYLELFSGFSKTDLDFPVKALKTQKLEHAWNHLFLLLQML